MTENIQMTNNELKNFLCKGWMTHDAMWFYHSLSEVGIEQTNEINCAAIKSMAMIEANRLKKILGVDKIDNFNELKRFSEGAYSLVGADFMKFHRTFPRENIYRWEVDKGECFAYKGINKLGVIDKYKCGIFYRIEMWFDSLGLTYEILPKVDGCMVHETGECYREYRFKFDSIS